MNSKSDQNFFFSASLEIAYDISKGTFQSISQYSSSYRSEELNFYSWPARRNRLLEKSIYSFPHIDSLYVQEKNNSNGNPKVFPRKSILRKRHKVPLVKARFDDYSYLRDYHFINDHYAELITDPYRELIYSVFVPGVDLPAENRLRTEFVAFTIMVYNSDLELQREVFFHAGVYDYRFYFVSPEGLCLHTAATTQGSMRVFDVFDLSKEGDPAEIVPEKLSLQIDLPPLASYLRDSLGLDISADSVVIISGIGCSWLS